jgi:hypothetical protein
MSSVPSRLIQMHIWRTKKPAFDPKAYLAEKAEPQFDPAVPAVPLSKPWPSASELDAFGLGSLDWHALEAESECRMGIAKYEDYPSKVPYNLKDGVMVGDVCVAVFIPDVRELPQGTR